jgi:hypothetical protein
MTTVDQLRQRSSCWKKCTPTGWRPTTSLRASPSNSTPGPHPERHHLAPGERVQELREVIVRLEWLLDDES